MERDDEQVGTDDAPAPPLAALLRWWPDAPLTAVAVVVVLVVHVAASVAGTVLGVVAAAVLVPLVLIDLRARRLPDPLTLGGAAALVAVLAVAGAWSGDLAPLWLGLGGAALLAGVLLVLHLIGPSGMGFGDVKLGLLLGVLVGSRGLALVLPTLLVAGVTGSLVGVGLAIATRRRRVTLPFGPCLVVGAVVSLALSAA